MIISRTPLRVSFFGGGTDYPDFYNRVSGIVVGMTINKYVYVSLSENSSFFDYKTRISYRNTELVNDISSIKHPSVKACLQYLGLDSGLDINIFSDIPARTGLGSSSSFTVGLLNALWALQGKRKSTQELAETACYIEQSVIMENVGSQDQFHAAFGGFNQINFNSDSIVAKPIIITANKKSILEASWLMFSTGISRYADPLLKEQIEKTVAKKNDSHLETIVEMSNKAIKIIIESSDSDFIFELGNLLHQSWEIKKKLSSKVSTDKIDCLYNKAMKAGAIGGKLSGAGSGGFLSFLVPKDRQDKVRLALSELQELPVSIEKSGSSIIYSR